MLKNLKLSNKLIKDCRRLAPADKRGISSLRSLILKGGGQIETKPKGISLVLSLIPLGFCVYRPFTKASFRQVL